MRDKPPRILTRRATAVGVRAGHDPSSNILRLSIRRGAFCARAHPKEPPLIGVTNMLRDWVPAFGARPGRAPKGRPLPNFGQAGYSAKERRIRLSHIQAFSCEYRQRADWKSEAGAEVPRALHDQDDRRYLHAHFCGSGTRRCNRSRTGNLRRFVPSCSQYREQEQLCGAKLGQGIFTTQRVTVIKKGA